MRIVMFYHSLVSDWNHGNAHFLRGIVSELLARGHDVQVYEPADGWSLQGQRAELGERAIDGFREAYPGLETRFYRLDRLDLGRVLEGADLVIVHEWSSHELVRRAGAHRSRFGRYRLLFHDTHHRAISEPESMAAYDLRHYDGILAFGRVLRDLYLERGWAARAWTWHEAADTRWFRPMHGQRPEGDLVWIGNWGDEERTAELHEFLLEPVKTLGLQAKVYGVRYPQHARESLTEAGIEYGGCLPNYAVPEQFARHKATVHVPRRPYREALPGIPTIRMFEALACGIPLVSAPWEDTEGLFTPGRDYLVARNGREMERHLWSLMNDAELRRELALHGRRTILARHTCRHRVDELLAIHEELQPHSIQAGEGVESAASARSGGSRALPYALGLLSLGACLAAGRRATSGGARGGQTREAQQEGDPLPAPATNGRGPGHGTRQEDEEVRA
jgi:spore maturation protein CgeB